MQTPNQQKDKIGYLKKVVTQAGGKQALQRIEVCLSCNYLNKKGLTCGVTGCAIEAIALAFFKRCPKGKF